MALCCHVCGCVNESNHYVHRPSSFENPNIWRRTSPPYNEVNFEHFRDNRRPNVIVLEYKPKTIPIVTV
ncbi:hypothetical protein I4U23_021961 [Adineta vaga]|nr:hypothetical protein I4U23_021961 [Adineta vaga]